MFTCSCATCEAKLIVKDENLIGKIVACPRCSGMVFVQPPDGDATPLSSKKTIYKKFPDILSHETASGIMGYVPDENRLSAVLLETEPESDVSEKEFKTRKILVGILIGLLLFLLVALGFLMMFHDKPVESIPPQPPPVPAPILPDPVEIPPLEPNIEEPVEVSGIPPSDEEPPLEPVSIPEEEIRTEEDIIARFNEKMPGFVDISLPNIDIDAKLALQIREFNFQQRSLIDFIRAMSQLTEIPMTLDIDEIKSHSMSVTTPVDGQFRDTTVRKILTETLATLELQWKITERQILILPKETDQDADLTFDVSDFAEKTEDMNPQKIADMIQALFCPDGNVSVSLDNQLVVTPNEPNGKSLARQRDEVVHFLEQLRVVRQLPQKTELTGETLAPEAFGWDKVMEPLTLHYYRAVPLSRAVKQLETLTGLTILVDHHSLHRSLCSSASLQATVQCEQGTVNDAIEMLLASVDAVPLVYRIIDDQTLEITTRESVGQPEKMVMEVHRYQLREEETPEECVRRLRLAVAPESWAVAESPETKYGGNVVIDAPSHCLFIRQSQPVHRQIRLSLSDAALPEP